MLADLDPDDPPNERRQHLLNSAYRHLAEDTSRARFLIQLEESPCHKEARARLAVHGGRLAQRATGPDMTEQLVDLAPDVIYALSLGDAVRLAAGGTQLKPTESTASSRRHGERSPDPEPDIIGRLLCTSPRRYSARR